MHMAKNIKQRLSMGRKDIGTCIEIKNVNFDLFKQCANARMWKPQIVRENV